MRASDLRRANDLAYELRGLYGSRSNWDGVSVINVTGYNEATGYEEVDDITATPEILSAVKSAVGARIADLEQQLDALGIKDLWTLEEQAGEDEDEDDGVEAEAA